MWPPNIIKFEFVIKFKAGAIKLLNDANLYHIRPPLVSTAAIYISIRMLECSTIRIGRITTLYLT